MSNSLWPYELQHARLSIINSQSLLKLMSIESVMPSNHLILCHPLLFLPSIFPSIRVFSNKSVLHIRWPKYRSFRFSISTSSEYSGLVSFRIDWFDLLAVQRTLKSLLQHHTSKASILWCSAFFMVQLSYPYMTTGKTIASVSDFIFGGSKITADGDCSHEIKSAYKKSYDKPRQHIQKQRHYFADKGPSSQSYSFSSSQCMEVRVGP